MCRRTRSSHCRVKRVGKIALIELLNGLLIPSHGKITINGRIITGGEGTDLLRDVGVVFQQSDDQLFAPTVPDDMILVLSIWK